MDFIILLPCLLYFNCFLSYLLYYLLSFQCFVPKHETLLYNLRRLDACGTIWIRQGATCPWSKGWMNLDNVGYILKFHLKKFFLEFISNSINL